MNRIICIVYLILTCPQHVLSNTIQPQPNILSEREKVAESNRRQEFIEHTLKKDGTRESRDGYRFNEKGQLLILLKFIQDLEALREQVNQWRDSITTEQKRKALNFQIWFIDQRLNAARQVIKISGYAWNESSHRVVAIMAKKVDLFIDEVEKEFKERAFEIRNPQAYVDYHKISFDNRPTLFRPLMDEIILWKSILTIAEMVIGNTPEAAFFNDLVKLFHMELVNYLSCIHLCLFVPKSVEEGTPLYVAKAQQAIVEIKTFVSQKL